MRKRNFTSLEVLSEQVGKAELQIFASQDRAKVREQNFTCLGADASTTHIIEFHPQYLKDPETIKRTVESEHDKTNTIICRHSECNYQPGHPKGLISPRPSEESGSLANIKCAAKDAGPGKMRSPTGVQKVAGSIIGSGHIAFVEIWS